MHLIARAPSQLGHHLRVFMRRIVSDDEDRLELCRDHLFDVAEQGEELLLPKLAARAVMLSPARLTPAR